MVQACRGAAVECQTGHGETHFTVDSNTCEVIGQDEGHWWAALQSLSRGAKRLKRGGDTRVKAYMAKNNK